MKKTFKVLFLFLERDVCLEPLALGGSKRSERSTSDLDLCVEIEI